MIPRPYSGKGASTIQKNGQAPIRGQPYKDSIIQDDKTMRKARRNVLHPKSDASQVELLKERFRIKFRVYVIDADADYE